PGAFHEVGGTVLLASGPVLRVLFRRSHLPVPIPLPAVSIPRSALGGRRCQGLAMGPPAGFEPSGASRRRGALHRHGCRSRPKLRQFAGASATPDAAMGERDRPRWGLDRLATVGM